MSKIDTNAVDLIDALAWLEDATQGDDASDLPGIRLREYVALAIEHADKGPEDCAQYTWEYIHGAEGEGGFCTVCAFIIGFENYCEVTEDSDSE